MNYKLSSVHRSWVSALPILSVLCTGLQWGCAPPPVAVYPTGPLSEEVRAQLGTIGIVSKSLSTPFTSPNPPIGWAQGFLNGVKTGTYYGAWPGLVISYIGTQGAGHPMGTTSAVGGIGLGTVGGGMGSTTGGLTGATRGSLHASPEHGVEHAMATLATIPGELRLNELLRDSVVQLVRDETSYNVSVFQTSEIPAPDDHAAYRALLDNGIDSLLELDLLEVGLTQGRGTAYDPPLRISFSVRTRLIRTEDGSEKDTRVIAFDERSVDDFVRMEPAEGRRPFDDWVAGNGRLFRQELPRTAQHLAEKIVETLFLLHPIETKPHP